MELRLSPGDPDEKGSLYSLLNSRSHKSSHKAQYYYYYLPIVQITDGGLSNAIIIEAGSSNEKRSEFFIYDLTDNPIQDLT